MDRLLRACFPTLALSFALICPLENEVWANGNPNSSLRVNDIDIDLQGSEPVVPDSLEPGKEKGQRTWIVQFDGPVRGADKERVINAGCRLLDYLPDFAFLAVMDSATKKEVEKLPFITGVARFKPDYKLSGQLREKAAQAPEGEQVRLHLKLDDTVQPGDVIAQIHKLNGKVLGVGRDSMQVAIDAGGIAGLAALDEVTWINEHVDMRIFNNDTRWVVQTNLQNDLRFWNNGLHGEGEIVGIGDTGLDHDMPWFRDPSGVTIGPGHRKLVGYDTSLGDNSDADYPGHGTHVSGTVAGDREPVDGVTGANGMAPKARIFIQDLSVGSTDFVNVPSDLGQLFTPAYGTGARLHSNSWGNSDNAYGPYAASSDRYTWEHRDLLPLFANGNGGPSGYTAGNPATAKNVISVGASYNGTSAGNMASFSSNGPTADGRIKPTVTAPGYSIISADSDGNPGSFNGGTVTMSGTSMATPAVAGAAALVRQYFAHGYHPLGIPSPGNAFSPSAALVKAVIINSAQNMTGSGTGGPIPSYGQGWGRINLASSLPLAGEARSLTVLDEGDPLESGGSWGRQFTVKSGDPLKVTLVWTDYPGATGASKALVNDLDLMVNAPDGTVFLGNAFVNGESLAGGAPDRLNVEEQVLVKTPLTGVYTVTVTGYNVPVGPQPFALAISGADDISPTGRIVIDRQKYNSGGTVLIEVLDTDLNADPARIEQIAIQVTSTAEPAGETVSLAETAANSAVFSGTLRLAAIPTTDADGLLQTAHGDVITVVYQDADDGFGRATTVTAVAIVDNVTPVISNIAIASISETGASITWSTDEPADTEVTYIDTLGAEATALDRRLMAQHAIGLAGLIEGETYRFTAASTDEAGNRISSSESFFTTVRRPPSLSVASSEGGTTYMTTTVISGISIDPSGVSLITVNGVPASYRSSDGFYTLAVSLQPGGNNFTLRATDSLGNEAVAVMTVTRLLPSELFMQSVAGPQTALQGGGITISDTVCNSGPGGAGGFSIGFHLSGDPSLSVDDTYLGERHVVSLAAGSCSSGNTTHTIAALAPGGTMYLLAIADNASSLVETNKSNNLLAGNQVTLPKLQLATPSSITVPATSSSGIFQVLFGYSNVAGVTYVLEMSTSGGGYAVVYSGTSAWANMVLTASGTYSFRVKATKAGYGDSVYRNGSSCVVTLVCGVPASLTVPATSSSGIFQVLFGNSNVGGVTYVLEMSMNNGGYTVVYSGTSAWANMVLTSNGNYSFRVKATRAGFGDSGYKNAASCVVTLVCGVPASLTVPATSSSGIFQVLFGNSTVGGVTYVLEMSMNGGGYAVVYSGTSAWANMALTANGNYHFRVKATRAGYGDSGYTNAASCGVTLVCGVPASITVPATNGSGSFQVLFGNSNVGGVTYVLEMRTNGGAYAVVYSGTNAWANMVLTTNGTYTFRVKATRTGYVESGFTNAASCVVTLVCWVPASITVPATSSSGSFMVSFGKSSVGGVTYLLEMSTNGGAYSVVYSGSGEWKIVTVPASGTYSFRVKAVKAGYADSGYTAPASCVVAMTSGSVVKNASKGTFHQSIDAAIATASTNDEIRVIGTYTGSSVTTSGSAVIVTLSGGWDSSHQTQTGSSSVGTVTIVSPGIIADRLVI